MPRTKIVERGTVPCQTCFKPHNLRREVGSREYGSWVDPRDKHPYVPMTAEQIVATYNLT